METELETYHILFIASVVCFIVYMILLRLYPSSSTTIDIIGIAIPILLLASVIDYIVKKNQQEQPKFEDEDAEHIMKLEPAKRIFKKKQEKRK